MSEEPKGLGPAHVTKITLCLKCGEHLDRMSGVAHGRGPKPNDISICIKCAHIMAVTDELGLRELTPAEQDEIAADTAVQRARYAVALTNLTNPWPKPPKGS